MTITSSVNAEILSDKLYSVKTFWDTASKTLFIKLVSMDGTLQGLRLHAAIEAPHVTELFFGLSDAKQILEIEIIGVMWQDIRDLSCPPLSRPGNLKLDLDGWTVFDAKSARPKRFYLELQREDVIFQANPERSVFRVSFTDQIDTLSTLVSPNPQLVFEVAEGVLNAFWIIDPNHTST